MSQGNCDVTRASIYPVLLVEDIERVIALYEGNVYIVIFLGNALRDRIKHTWKIHIIVFVTYTNNSRRCPTDIQRCPC